MRSPTDLPAAVAAFAGAHEMLPRGGRVLCALSGGTDSMALLTVLLALQKDFSFTLLAAHFNHQLRGAESQRDEAFVTHWCRKVGVPLTVGRGNVAAQAALDRKGVEETARKLRYTFLEQTADAVGAAKIATAHNAEDNVETILLHLTRGAGLDGLTGIPPVRGRLIRPLITQSRARLEDYLLREGVPHVEDSSNADPAYARNRLRREVLPVLRSLNPNLSATVAAALPALRADRDALDALAQQAASAARWEGDALRIPTAALTQVPEAVAARCVKRLLAQLHQYCFSASHIRGVLALAASPSPSARLSLPGTLTLRREYDTLIFSREEAREDAFLPARIPPGAPVSPPGCAWTIGWEEGVCPPAFRPQPHLFYLAALSPPLWARPRQQGDVLRLPGRPEKPVKKWLVEEKIPRSLRDRLPVLEDGNGLLAVAGLGPAEGRLARPGEPAVRVSLTPREEASPEHPNNRKGF